MTEKWHAGTNTGCPSCRGVRLERVDCIIAFEQVRFVCTYPKVFLLPGLNFTEDTKTRCLKFCGKIYEIL